MVDTEWPSSKQVTETKTCVSGRHLECPSEAVFWQKHQLEIKVVRGGYRFLETSGFSVLVSSTLAVWNCKKIVIWDCFVSPPYRSLTLPVFWRPNSQKSSCDLHSATRKRSCLGRFSSPKPSFSISNTHWTVARKNYRVFTGFNSHCFAGSRTNGRTIRWTCKRFGTVV